MIRELLAALRAVRIRATNEDELQRGVAAVLDDAGIRCERHRALSRQDIPDFMIGSIAVELKVKGSLADVTRQLHRYAQHEAVSELVLITTMARHRAVPRQLNNKPVTAIVLEVWL